MMIGSKKMSKKIFLFVLAVVLVPIVQATPIQINDQATFGEKPIVLDEGNLACIFWPTTNQLSINCVDPSTGTRKGNDIRIGDLVKNIDSDYLNGKFAVVGERGDDLKVFLVDKNGQGTNFDISRLGVQSNPKISLNPDDSQIGVVWQDNRNGQSDIYFQIFDLNGNHAGNEILASVNGTNPDVEYDTTRHRYTIVYQNSVDQNLYFLILEKSGSAFLSNTILSNSTGLQSTPKIGGNSKNEEQFAVYTDNRQGLGTDIFATDLNSSELGFLNICQTLLH